MQKINKLIAAISLCLLWQYSFAINVTIPQNLQNNIAISINNLKTNQTVYNYHESMPMLIASNMKVITSYAALQSFSPKFSWTTKLAYSGKIQNSILNGDVYLIGGGDPTLTSNDISQMFESLSSVGIKKVNGHVYYDSSIFNSNVISSELHPEPLASYSVEPSGLLIDSNMSYITLAIKQNKISLHANFQAKYKLVNNLSLLTRKAPCNDPSSYITIFKQKNTLQLTGAIPKSCNKQKLPLYLLDNNSYNQQVIRQTLTHQKIRYLDNVSPLTAPKSLTIITTHNSIPLADIITQMNQQSNNLYAKTLLLSLGAYYSKNNNTYTDGKQAYLNNLANKFNFTELASSLENGAGLSRQEKMTTAHIGQLLNTIYTCNESQLIIQSLPTPGKDGTLRDEFPMFINQLYAKTGSLSDTKAYSGYFFSKTGNVYSVSFVANNISTNSKPSQLTEFKQLITSILNQL